jgi:hypothetical protein
MVLRFGWVFLVISLLSGMVMIGVGFPCLGQSHCQSTGKQHCQRDQPNSDQGGWHRIEVLDRGRP